MGFLLTAALSKPGSIKHLLNMKATNLIPFGMKESSLDFLDIVLYSGMHLSSLLSQEVMMMLGKTTGIEQR